ncbi:TonB-dependent receptor, partial [Flavobacteriaceae bacterium]|nr:TonB-dependent receptor [Flavobacteriaceae bacterium]
MKKLLTLWVFCIVVLGTLKGLAQGPTNAIIFKEVPLNRALDSVALHTGAKIYYAQDWVKDLVVNGSYAGSTPKILLEALISGTNLNVFEWERQYIITQNTLIYPDIVASFYRGEFQKANSSDSNEFSSKLPLEINFNNKTNPRDNPLKRTTITIGKQTNYIAVNGYIISGKITEADGITPIPNATIILNNQEDYTSTDGSGDFAFEGISYGSQLLKVSIVGYQNVEQPIKVFNNGSLNLSLQESFEALEEVVVKAGAKKAVEEVGSGGSSFTPEETKNIPLVLGERDLFKVATTLPGVSSAGEGASGFNVRGGKTDQNLILLDRAVVYNPTHFFGLFPALNPFAVAALNVYKGSIPAQYGGRLSAVFDMETKTPNNQTLKGEASLGPITANLMLEIPLQKDSASLLIGGRSAHANWVLGALKEESLANSTALFYDGIIKYQQQLNKKNTLKTSLYHSKDAFSITSDSIYGYTNTALSIQWQRQLANKQFLNTAVTHSRYGFTIDYEGNGNNGFKQGYELTDSQLLINTKIEIYPKHTLAYGVMIKNYQMQPGFNKPYSANDLTTVVNLEAEQALEMAVFASDLINISDKTAVELGLRYNVYTQLGALTQRTYEPNSPFNNGSLSAEEFIDKGQIAATYTGLAPRISFRYLLNDNNSIKASYNKAFQFIHTLSNATTPAPNDSWKLSDNNIKPQASEQVSIGYYHNSSNQKYTASAEGFFKRQENLLDFKTGASLVLNS